MRCSRCSGTWTRPFSGGDGNAFGDLFTDDGRLLLLYHDPVILLMNSHARRIEKVT